MRRLPTLCPVPPILSKAISLSVIQIGGCVIKGLLLNPSYILISLKLLNELRIKGENAGKLHIFLTPHHVTLLSVYFMPQH